MSVRERHYQIILGPVISEKATLCAERSNTVVFRVLASATKEEIKEAVEAIFKVEVEAVNVVNQKGKLKRFGRQLGRRAQVRKAYVTLKEGQELDLLIRGA